MNDPLGLFEPEEKGSDPLGLFSNDTEPAGYGTAIKSAFAGLGNTADTAASMIAGGAASAFGQLDDADKIYKGLEERIGSRNDWGNPQNQEIKGLPKLAGIAATLPGQIVNSGLAPAEVGKNFIDQGENLQQAQKAAMVSAGTNVVGMIAPGALPVTPVLKALSAGGINAVVQMFGNKGLQEVADLAKTKKSYENTPEDVFNNFLIGLAAHGVAGIDTARQVRNQSDVQKKLAAQIKANQANPSTEPPPSVDRNVDPVGWQKRQDFIARNLANQEANAPAPQQGEMPLETSSQQIAERRGAEVGQPDLFGPQNIPKADIGPEIGPKPVPEPIDTMSQHGLFDMSEDARLRNPTEAVTGDWRVDENGIPIKADLSMEAANLENPLQRNLWGDELPPKHEQEGTPLTEAIDSMPNPPWDSPRSEGIDMLSNGVRSNRFGGGQRGSAPIINDAAKLLERVLGKNGFFTENMPGKDILEQSLQEGKDGKGVNSLEAGASMTAVKRRSTLIREGGRWFQSAPKKAELSDRVFINPTERMFKGLSRQEITDLASVMLAEKFNRSITPEQVLNLGLSARQLEAYNSLRKMHAEAFRQQNEYRVSQGKPPMTEAEYYLSSRWTGDYRMPVHDAAGNLKWYLASDYPSGLNMQFKALKKEFPDYVAGEVYTRHTTKGGKNPSDVLASVIDALGRDDPAVARIKSWAEQEAMKESGGAFGQEKHFENSANIRGFVGDRPGKNPTKEAIALFQQQMTYARNAFKWVELQKAASEMKEAMNSPELKEQQPNNVAYMQDYIRNHLGMGEANWVAALGDAMRSKGVSPHLISAGIGTAKTVFIMQKLAVSAGFSIVNAIQYVNLLPHLVGESLNPIAISAAVTAGIPLGMTMALSHYVNAARGKVNLEPMKDKFIGDAMKYAEANGITARSVLDESPISHSFSALGQVQNFAGHTLSAPESVLRSISFMTSVMLLKQTGKFAGDNMGLYRHAEEMVNRAMGDYRPEERALAFSKLGTLGNALNTLQTYPFNYYQQWNLTARQALRGNPAPLLTMIAAQGLVGGMMAMPGFNEIDKLINWIKSRLPNEQYAKVKDIDLRQMTLRAGGQDLLYGPLSTKTGIGLTSRVTAPTLTDMLSSPGGPAMDLGKQAYSVADAALSGFANKDKNIQAALNVAPTGIQGALEVGPFRDDLSNPNKKGRLYRDTNNVEDHKGKYTRTPGEESLRAWGLRSQAEIAERDKTFMQDSKNKEVEKRGYSLVNEIYSSARLGNPNQTEKLAKLYVELTGKSLDSALQKQVMDEYTTAYQRATTGAKTIEAMKNIKRMQDLFEKK